MAFKSFLGSVVRYISGGMLRTRPRGGSRPQKTSLFLEVLEAREVLAASPFVVAVTPIDGAINQNPTPQLQIQYSEQMASGGTYGANNASSYILLDSEGDSIGIASATFSSTVFTNDTVTLNLAPGQAPLVADTYSLFVRGDKIHDLNDNLALATAPQLIAVNGGTNNVSVMTVNSDGSIGAASEYVQAPNGTTQANPYTITFADFDGDGLPDMVVANATLNTLAFYSGKSADEGGGFSLDPDLTLALPNATTTNQKKVLIARDFNNDGMIDLAVMNQDSGTVSIFENNRANVGDLSFGASTDITGFTSPQDMIAADFDGDGYVDLAVANGGLVSSNYNVSILRNISAPGGTGNPVKFDVATNIAAGTNNGATPPVLTGVQAPIALAAGKFVGNDNLLDIAVAGNNGVIVLQNATTVAQPTLFTVPTSLVYTGTGILGLKTAQIDAGTRDDLVANTATGLTALLNNNQTTWVSSTTTVAAGAGGQIAIGDLDPSGTYSGGMNEFAVSNAAATGQVTVLHRTKGFGVVENVTVGSGTIDITSKANGLVNGETITLAGLGGFTAGATGQFTVTVLDADTFRISTSVTGAYTGGGTWVRSGSIASSTVSNGAVAITTTPAHHLTTGTSVTVAGSTGGDGTYTITVTGTNTFILNGAPTAGVYSSATYVVASALAVDSGGPTKNGTYATGATPTGLALTDFNGDGNLDLATADRTGNTITLMMGAGDSTFQVPTTTTLTAQPTPSAVAYADLNNDGIRDIIIVNNNTTASSSRVTVMLGQPDGTYAAPFNYSVASGGTVKNITAVTTGDIDGNGKQDIILVGAGQVGSTNVNGLMVVMKNNISGVLTASSFQAQTPIKVGDAPTGVVAADFDGDGDVDIAISHNRGGGFGGASSRRGVSYLKNTRTAVGTVSFAASTEVSQVAGFAASGLVVLDYNKDGKADLAVIENASAGRVAVLTGNGNGTFTQVGRYSSGLSNLVAAAVGDFNGDGFLDVAVASSSTGSTSGGVSVLTNELGTGFATGTRSDVQIGTPLASLVVSDVNQDGKADLVVGTASVATPPTPTPTQVADNIYVLTGHGDATFNKAVPYFAGGVSGATPYPPPTYLAIGPSPLLRLTTFSTGGTTVRTNLLVNGDFEHSDLTGEHGNLTGWQAYDLPDTPSGSKGKWSVMTGNNSPLSGTPVGSPVGNYQAMLDEPNLQPYTGFINPNPDDSYEGSHALYQDFTIPANATQASLSLRLYVNSDGSFVDTNNGTQLLDYRTPEDNQQVRVDILSPTGSILAVNGAPNLLANAFITSSSSSQIFTKTVTLNLLAIPAPGGGTTSLAGQTVRLRIAATNNQGKLIVGVDEASITVKTNDAVAPTLSGLHLRNPGFLLNGVQTTSDTNIIGTASDNAGINNLAYVEFDTLNNGFADNDPDDFKITQFNAMGSFTADLNTRGTLPKGVVTVGVRVVDKAGNVATSTFTFNNQAISSNEWMAVGPNGIQVDNKDYKVVTGRITSTAYDPSDNSSNTYYVGTANGGVWKTTDGGASWTPLMDYLSDGSGTRIFPPIGAVAVAHINTQTVFAGLGVGDLSLDSRSGSGILKSTDGGQTWVVAGDSATVLKDARISSIVIDDDDPDPTKMIIYAGVVSGGVSGPGVYKSTDGGATWTLAMSPANMTGVAAGTALASVTDMILDPYNHSRILVGLGNIGMGAASTTAGVWLTVNKGQSWALQTGGDKGASSVLPSGATLGAVKIAIGNDRISAERYVYVAIGTVPTANIPPNVDLGGYSGLYKSSDNMVSFTKVMLRQNTTTDTSYATGSHSFQDISFGSETSYAMDLVVDPTNPNVVYVGGSRRFNETNNLVHALVRVDTGNMRDGNVTLGNPTGANDGDDASKANTAADPKHQGWYDYDPVNNTQNDPYAGEGVSWYDLEQQAYNGNGKYRGLPPSITSLSLDGQGRILIGTNGGIWRAANYGAPYDFTSDSQGIVRGKSPDANFGLTSLNGNLQISELTSVAIDPTVASTYHITTLGTGGAGNVIGSLDWASEDLTGPTVVSGGIAVNMGIPNAGTVVASAPAVGSPAGTPPTLFRLWQYTNQAALVPEVSSDGGETWSIVSAAGIPATGNSAGVFPAIAINPNKVYIPAQGIYADELLLGTNKIYLTRTSANVWDVISPTLGTGTISAVAVAATPPIPGTGYYYAGTSTGQIFVAPNGGGTNSTDWPERDTGLPALPVLSIAIDPNVATTAYVTFGGQDTTTPRVWKTIDGGLTWTNISSNLPVAATYGIVIDRAPGLNAPGGKIYAATNLGVYVSINEGGSWTRVGASMPTAPVVNLQQNSSQQVLAAATQGRGLYVLSTSPILPMADQTTNEDTQTGVINIALNGLGVPTANLVASVTSSNITLPDGTTVVPNSAASFQFSRTSDTDYQVRITPALNQFGTYTITVHATDGINSFSTTFKLTVNSVNDLPVVTGLTNVAVPSSPAKQTIVIPFNVSDVETPANSLILSAVSDNSTLIPGSIAIAGQGTSRALSFDVPAGVEGTSVITLTVTDGDGGVTTRTVAVNVSGNATLPFTDDFDRADNPYVGSEWTDIFGDLQVAGNKAVNGTPGVAIATLNGVSEADEFAQADINLTPGQTAGLLSRYSASGYYRVDVTATAASTIATLYAYSAGGGQSILGSAVISGPGTLRLETVGTSQKVFFNGNLVIFGHDASVTAPGTVGIKAGGSTAGTSLDNFAADQIATVTPGLAYTGTFSTATAGQLDNTRWVETYGNFAVNTGASTATSAPGAGLSIALLRNASAADEFAQVNYSVTAGQTAGLFSRYSANGYYRADVVSNGGNATVFLWVYSPAGGQVLIGSAPVANAGTLRLETIGTSQKVFVGGTLVISAHDASVAAPGTVGMKAQGATLSSFAADQIAAVTTLPYSDTFSTATAAQLDNTRWVETYGNFAVTGGTASNVAIGTSIALLRGVSAADEYAQVDYNITSGQAAGLLSRYSANGYYRADVVSNGGNATVSLYAYSPAGGQVFLGSATVANSGILRLETVGTSQKVFVGGSLVISAHDASVTAPGTVGIKAAGTAGASLDNFSADKITPPTTPLPASDNFSTAIAGQLDSDRWVETYGNFAVNTGASTATSAPGAGLSIALLRGASAADEFAQVNYSVTAGQTAGLFSRYSANGYYRADVVSNGGNVTVFLWVYSPAGGQVLIGSAPVANAGTLRLETVGTSQKVFFNGNLVISAHDARVAAPGTVGMKSQGAILSSFSADEVTPPTTPLPASDNFNSSAPATNLQLDDSMWVETYGNFAVTGGTASNVAIGTSIALLRGVSAADEYAQVDYNITSGQAAGLLSRYSANGYYRADVVSNGGNATVSLYAYSPAGGQVFLGSATVANSGILRLETVGTSQKVFVGGSLVISAHDASVTAPGTVGIKAAGTAGASLDNFSADQIATVTPGLAYTGTFSTATAGQLDNTRWVETYGNFAVNTGASIVTNVPGAGVSIALLRNASAADEFAQVDYSAIAGQTAGLFSRYSASGYYRVDVTATTANTTATLYAYSAGGGQSILGSAVISGLGTLRLETVGTSQKVFFNGNLVIFGHDASVTAPGTVGIKAGGPTAGGTSLDNFAADQIATVTPGLAYTGTFSTATAGQLDNTRWVETYGNFAVNTGASTVTSAPTAGMSIALLRNASAADEFAQVNYSVTAGQTAGLFSRYSANGYYRADLVGNGANATVSLWAYSPTGGQVFLGSATVANSGVLRLETVGTSQKVFVGGTLVISAHDASVAAPGTVGMKAQGATLSSFAADQIAPVTTLPYSDNFSTATAAQLNNTRWVETYGNFQVTGGTASNAVAGVSIAQLRGINSDAVFAQASIAVAAGQTAGLLTQYSSTGYYRVDVVGSGATATATLYAYSTATGQQTLGTATIANSGTLRMETKKGLQQVFFNGTLLFSTADTSLGAGTVAIKANGPLGVSFDNFSAGNLP